MDQFPQPRSKVEDDEGGDLLPTFAETPGLSLAGVTVPSLAWGDCDNDGDLDLAIAGRDASLVLITKVYENDGAGGFSEFLGLALTGVWGCGTHASKAPQDWRIEV